MNASALTLSGEVQVQSKIRKIRTFGRGARFVCVGLFGIGAVFTMLSLIYLVFDPFNRTNNANGGAISVLGTVLTPLQLRASVFSYLMVEIGLALAVVYHLYRLFGNLAAGAIYTRENLHRVRKVGLLWLLLAAFEDIVIPVALFVLQVTYGESNAMVPIRFLFLMPERVFSYVAVTGLFLLGLWILEVGLHEKNSADALQRDAELTI